MHAILFIPALGCCAACANRRCVAGGDRPLSTPDPRPLPGVCCAVRRVGCTLLHAVSVDSTKEGLSEGRSAGAVHCTALHRAAFFVAALRCKTKTNGPEAALVLRGVLPIGWNRPSSGSDMQTAAARLRLASLPPT